MKTLTVRYSYHENKQMTTNYFDLMDAGSGAYFHNKSLVYPIKSDCFYTLYATCFYKFPLPKGMHLDSL